ncbi:ring canal kelch homolog isoform X2 [Culicoides brevitarsis]|uniref:ring canal kelch homolog isoform X2 n=1 Tax=Culicoides brevitarsis TaxID=469753 RepID=UPI00307BD86F
MVKTRINIHMDNFDEHTKDILKDVYENSLNCDVILRVGDRKFPTHKAVLAFGSDFLKEIIEENTALQPGQTPTISIPEVDPDIVEEILNFIYTGETRLKEERFMEFVDVCNLLKLKSMANYEYVKYISFPEENATTSEPADVENNYIENVTIIGNDYAEIVKSVTQEESVAEESEMLCDSNPLSDHANYEVIEVIEQQTTEDDSKVEHKLEPGAKRKRVSTHLREGDPRYKENLEAAMHEVIYNKKDNPGNQELNQTILDELTSGETLLGISRKYNIPVSTLHRRKTMLFEKGDLPESVRIKQRNRGEDFAERLEQAIAEVENGLSQTEASKKYRIPKTTIWRRLKRTNPRLASAKADQSVDESYEIINTTIKTEDFKVVNPDES